MDLNILGLALGPTSGRIEIHIETLVLLKFDPSTTVVLNRGAVAHKGALKQHISVYEHNFIKTIKFHK